MDELHCVLLVAVVEASRLISEAGGGARGPEPGDVRRHFPVMKKGYY
jgi:hypothetical protein